jgi:hypothetical protein
MKTVYIVFTRNWLPFSGLIRLVTWSVWSHVQVCIDGRLIGAQPLGGVQRRSLHAGLKGVSKAAVAAVDLTDGEYTALRHLLQGQLGRGYDWRGLVGLAARAHIDAAARWFCSELPAWAFSGAGKRLIAQDAWRTTPQQLWVSPVITARMTGERGEIEVFLTEVSRDQ